MKFFHIARSFAIAGALVIGVVIGMSSIGIVNAARVFVTKSCTSSSACATYTNSGRGSGIEGNNTNSGGPNAFGVLGTSSGTDGVHGISTHAGSSGIAGIHTGTGNTSGNGAYAQSDGTGAGVYATSAEGNGVTAYSTGGGGSGKGVYGDSKNGSGVFAESDSSTGNYALVGVGDGTATDLLEAYNSATGDACYINSSSDLSCNGSITGGAFGVRQRTSGARRVLAYASESASATIEDVGTAQLYGGVANVQISADFASVVDPRAQYYVFVTPLGETRGLYVAAQSARSFTVRENEHGRSSTYFNYRIVAHPLAASNYRLPPATTTQRPELPPRP